MSWYYANGGQRNGPVEDEEFFQLVQRGQVRDDTLVWKQGMGDWKRYAEVAPALAIPPVLPGATVASGPRDFAQEQSQGGSFSSSQALRSDIFPKRVFAGFWLRVVARLIDGVILWIVGQIVSAIVTRFVMPDAMKTMLEVRNSPGEVTPEQIGLMMQAFLLIYIIQLAIGLTYEIIFVSKVGATPGKMALGLRIERADGSRLSVGRIIGRYFGQILSALIFGIGYIIAAFDEEKRALHDHLCDTRVVKKNPSA